MLFYSKNNCIARGSGNLDLGNQFRKSKFYSCRTITNYMINDSALIRIAAAMDFFFNDDCMRILAETVDGSYQLEGIDIVENENYQHALMKLLVLPISKIIS